MPESAENADLCRCAGCQAVLTSDLRFCRLCGRSVQGDVVDSASSIAQAQSYGDFEARWKNFRTVGWLFGLLLATSFVFGLVARGVQSPWLDVVASSLDAFIIVAFAIARRADVFPLFSAPSCNRRTAVVLVIVCGVFVILMTGYFDVLKHLGIPMLSVTADYHDAHWAVWTMYVSDSVVPGIFEEIAFRGVIQSALEREIGARDAWLIQGALFSVLHLTPLAFPSHFVMGLVFGYLRLKTRSLYPGMALHAGWNALQVISEL